jgi:hypothetical protein
MKGNDYEVHLGGKLIGYARDVSDDMPNTGGCFEPTDLFGQFEDLFEREFKSIRKSTQEWQAERDHIFSLGLVLRSPEGDSVIPAYVGQKPGSQYRGELAYLHIHGGRIWWRLM